MDGTVLDVGVSTNLCASDRLASHCAFVTVGDGNGVSRCCDRRFLPYPLKDPSDQRCSHPWNNKSMLDASHCTMVGLAVPNTDTGHGSDVSRTSPAMSNTARCTCLYTCLPTGRTGSVGDARRIPIIDFAFLDTPSTRNRLSAAAGNRALEFDKLFGLVLCRILQILKDTMELLSSLP